MNGTADGGETMPASLGANRLPTRPTALSVQSDGIPAELMRRPQWVAWRYRWDGQTQRWQKPPVSPRTDGPASPTKPATWGTFDEALDRVEISGCDGIGFVLTSGDPYVAVDLDDCIDLTTGKPTPFAENILRELASYTEFSPSGTGLRILIKGTLAGGNRKRPDIEISADRQYVTITGDRVPRTPEAINDRSTELAALVARLFPMAPPAHLSRPSTPTSPSRPTPVATLTASDREILSRARRRYGQRFNRLYDDGDPSAYNDDHSRADLGFLSLLTPFTQDPEQLDRLLRCSGLYRDKWERDDYRERTIEAALDRSVVAQTVKHPSTTGGVGGVPRAAQPRPAPSHPGRCAGSPGSGRGPTAGDAGQHERRCRTCGNAFVTKRGVGGHRYCPACRERGMRSTRTGRGSVPRADPESKKGILHRVLRRDRQTCLGCRDRAHDVAYLVPPSQGGSYTDENLLALCDACRNVAPHLTFPTIEAKVSHIRRARKLR